MRQVIALVLVWTCLSVYSQNNFAEIKKEVDTWCQSVNPVSDMSKKPSKSINFANYSIDGNIAKGILCEGTTAKFYDTTSLVPELLLEGRVFYQAGRLVIEGIRYLATSKSKIYGTFYVYNMEDFTMNYKPKKAGALRIKTSDPSYLQGFYYDRHFIVRMKNVNTVYLDRKKSGNSFAFLSAEIPDIEFYEDDSFDIYKILLQAKDGVTMCWDNGEVFKGVIKTKPVEGGLTAFIPMEGQKTGMNNGPYRISVSRQNGNIVYSQDYGENDTLLSQESWIVKNDGSISEEDYWNVKKILENCYLSKWKYKNGCCFEGTMKYAITFNEDSICYSVTRAPAKGVLKYPNGDRFEGELSSKSVGQFYVDGTTYFSDGSEENGNWLEKFKLSNSQWQEIYKCSYPSEAKALARKFAHRNNFPEYKYSGEFTYFNPSHGGLSRLYDTYVVYNKAEKNYTCKKSNGNEIILIFVVDNKGYRKWEIVYEDERPAYINEFEWYSNGIIESIKSYSYGTKKIYLACHFFSDGKLRSAYQYSKGNDGNIIIRKSKESHPTYGGYTSKLYDLDGNYERTIEWSIGEDVSIFGRYRRDMAPNHIKLSDFKPIENLK